MLGLIAPPRIDENTIPPLSEMEVEVSTHVRDGRDRWSFDSMEVRAPNSKPYADGPNHRYMIIRRNGVIVRRILLSEVWGNYIRAKKLPLRTGYPVVAIRAVVGFGEHWDTKFFAIRNRRLIDMGRPPAMNSNGPTLFHGNPSLWLFDNYDMYEMRDSGRKFEGVVERVGRNGKLKVVRTFPLGSKRVPRVYAFPEME